MFNIAYNLSLIGDIVYSKLQKKIGIILCNSRVD